jgi:CHASE2 domain-containing sensor protein
MPCPDAQQFEALLRGQLAPREEAALSGHVEGCVECRKQLEVLAGGAGLIPQATTKLVQEPSLPLPGLVRVIEKLRRTLLCRPGRRSPLILVSSRKRPTVDEFGCEVKVQAPLRRSSPEANLLAIPWWRSRLAGAGLCVLLGALWLALDVEPRDLKLRTLSYDLPFHMRGSFQPENVRIVSIDTEVKKKLAPGRDKLSRSWHAKMLQQAFALGAEMVVFDILFTQPADDPAEDQQFASALRSAPGKVVLGVNVSRREEGDAIQSFPRLPIPVLERVSAWGMVDFEPDKDGRVRRHFVGSDVAHPALAWEAARLLGKAPGDPLRPRWINYYGNRGTIPKIRYDRFLDQSVTDTNLLAGQIVFVGRNPTTLEGTDDEFATPYTTRTGETSTGVEMHATAFLNLIRGEWLEELPRTLEYALIVGLGLCLSLSFSYLRPGWAVVWSIAGFVVLALSACLLMWFKHRWFPWLIVGAVQIPCALIWSVAARMQPWAREEAARHGPGMGEAAQSSAVQDPRRLPEIPDHAPLRCVGRGGYGEVWLARDVIGSYHAVKVVYRNTFKHNEPFEREFRGIEKFTPISRLHPGWVHILHVGRNEAQGYFYYIMELGDDETGGQQFDVDRYVPKTLSGELEKRSRFPLEECIRLGLALADALEHLHEHGLIHRDIKPSNVVFVRNAPKFTDIGLVTEAGDRGNVSWIGTEGYMAPEGPGTPAADVFGLGKLIYEAATGRDRKAFPEMHTALSNQAATLEERRFHHILLKACAESPAQRYASAAELHRDLLQLLNAIEAGRIG